MKKISTKYKYQGNPRKITEKQFGLLKNHLEELGDLSGVVYCNNQKAFVGGNQRSEVFNGAEIEYTETYKEPTNCQTLAIGFIKYNGEKYAYREVFFTEEQFRKACIVANNDGGTFDFDILANEWDPIELEDWGMEIPHVEEEEKPKGSAPDDKLTLKFTPDMLLDIHTAIAKMSETDDYKYAEYHDDDKAKALWLICREYININ